MNVPKSEIDHLADTVTWEEMDMAALQVAKVAGFVLRREVGEQLTISRSQHGYIDVMVLNTNGKPESDAMRFRGEDYPIPVGLLPIRKVVSHGYLTTVVHEVLAEWPERE
ncbi:hypothetical protein [Amycolatopsis sp.]|uniref:hypothetical protein n=1 Tax=Amycolatopsis sp. TaxID=37632 RepID=UPI002BC82BDE|nr:hypothetical protein [Amycolatopsis sp.]HVV12092.1 hypothetical protein [Amycolatopsis sp.]